MNELMRCIVASAGIRKEPKATGSLETELLFGETFEIESIEGGWVFGKSSVDGYPGYVALTDLGPLVEPTHRVTARTVVVYLKPGFKSHELIALSMNSLVRVKGQQETPEGVMCELQAGWVFKDQICPVDEYADDFVAEATKFLETPYLWGAKSFTIDCSALLQVSLQACGIQAPRDCVPQSKAVGKALEFFEEDLQHNLRRGDLVFWTEGKGRHVVIMTDSVNCIHASIAQPRKVVIQPLAEVIADQARDGNGPITMVRRLN